ncbi:hypothetical protein [Bacillus pumilus]|uniref:hypothetical protein n=1 Tax=Bacillus pumilus TaxID=1408 RepID=UPI0011A4B51A|nr:hypothetical protein [Bacillus pumilus]
MKKLVLVFLGLMLFLAVPLQTAAAVNQQPNEIKDSHKIEIEGKIHTFTYVLSGGVQTVSIDNGENVDVVSYNSNKEELRINNELVDNETVEQIKSGIGEDLKINEESQFNTLSNKSYNWKHVKSYKNEINITTTIVFLVTGAILMLPTGTGAVAGAIFTAKAIAVIVSAVISSSGSTGQKKFYYTVKTYYSPKNGYWNNKFILTVYKDKKRKKKLTKVTHQTRLGKKY